MTKRIRLPIVFSVALLAGLLLFAGCGDGASEATYRITVTNNTNNQPMSPLAFIFHKPGYRGWMIGDGASSGVEWLAESGNSGPFIEEAKDHEEVVLAVAADSLLLPGGEVAITRKLKKRGSLQLTVATMLVNTNDGFAGEAAISIGGLRKGENIKKDLLPFDAGTEENSETAGSVPGPAGGGEGYNSERPVGGFVSVHPGVVTGYDGLETSTLDESHRFQSPVARITVTRID